jgi:hypothetical protein
MTFQPFRSFGGFGGSVNVEFTPLAFGPSLWLSDTGSDAGVWPDLSGSGNNALQADANKQPAIVAGAMNSRQVRRYDGTADLMTFNAIALSNCTVFVVVKDECTSYDGPMFFGGGTQSGPGTWSYLWRTQTGQVRFTNDQEQNVSNTTTRVTNGTYIYSVRKSGVAGKVWRNNIPLVSGNFASNANVTLRSVGYSYGAAYYGKGDFAEFIVYPTALSDAQCQQVRTWLAAKYAIPIGTNESAFYALEPLLLMGVDTARITKNVGGDLAAVGDPVYSTVGETGSLIQATVANQPIIHTDGGIYFDGVNDVLQTPGNLIFDYTIGVDLTLVFKYGTNWQCSANHAFYTIGNGYWGYPATYENGVNSVRHYSAGWGIIDLPDSIRTRGKTAHTFHYDSTARLKSWTPYTGAATPVNDAGAWISGSGTTGPQKFPYEPARGNNLILYFMAITRTMTADERTAAWAELATRFGAAIPA